MKNIKKFNEDFFENNSKDLTKEEKEWLKNWLISCKNQWGFESKDIEYMDSIFTKLGI